LIGSREKFEGGGLGAERGVEVIPRLFRHLLWRTFLDYLSSFIQWAEFLGLWQSALEQCETAGSDVAKFVEE
jgi:hypothetical protein